MSERFSERWAQRERECGFEEIAAGMVALGADTLPLSAAPCLAFQAAHNPKPVFEVFGAVSDWSEEDRSRLERFLVIGSDGAGNPICLDEPTGKVVLLDHEDKFRSIQFVNSSVRQLAECLLAYLGQESAEPVEMAVQAIDPEALNAGAFWTYEIKGFT